MLDPIHYIVVRKDLPVGTAMAMVAHAAADSVEDSIRATNPMWLTADGRKQMTAIVLEVPDKDALLDVVDKLEAADVHFTPVFETGSPWDGQLMAIGAWPGERETLAPHFAHLTLYKELDVKVHPDHYTISTVDPDPVDIWP